MAKQLGISIPEDFSIVGYDDQDFTMVSLTTMHQPIYEMGQESMKLIMSRIIGDVSESKKIVLPFISCRTYLSKKHLITN